MLLKNENQIIRVLKSHGDKALVIDCIKRTIKDLFTIFVRCTSNCAEYLKMNWIFVFSQNILACGEVSIYVEDLDKLK